MVCCQDAATHTTPHHASGPWQNRHKWQTGGPHKSFLSQPPLQGNTNRQSKPIKRESEQALFHFFPLFINPPYCTFSPVSHINTVVGKGKSRDPAVENGAVGTQLRVFTVGSCLVHSALHALLKVDTLKVCSAELQGKGSE